MGIHNQIWTVAKLETIQQANGISKTDIAGILSGELMTKAQAETMAQELNAQQKANGIVFTVFNTMTA